MPSIWNTVTGVADDAAGSTDEAFGRQFDDKAGGGFRAGFGEELGSSRPSFLTGAGQFLGVVPRGTAEQRQTAVGPGVQRGGTKVWGGGTATEDGTTAPSGSTLFGALGGKTIVFAVVAIAVLWLIRPLLEIGAGVSE